MIDRQTMVEQSVTEFAKAALLARGYAEGPPPAGAYEMTETFPWVLVDEFTQNLLTIGFNFDDGGEPAETGSSLTRMTYTIEFFVFGLTNAFARNLAAVLKFGLDSEGAIPLKDYEQVGEPEIDRMVVLSVSSERQTIVNPEPWQENVWTCTLRIEDVYMASLV